MVVLQWPWARAGAARSVFRFGSLEHAAQRHDLAETGVARPADARDRVERGSLDLAVVHQAVADVEHHDLADDEAAAGVAEFEALPEAAFHRNGCNAKTRHLDALARDRLKAKLRNLADLRRMLDR